MKSVARSPHATRMARMYRFQARAFDFTRGPILLGRHRLADPLHAGAAVLEVGCGTGINFDIFRAATGPDGRIVGVDCAPAMLRRARRRDLRGVTLMDAEYGVDPIGCGPFDAIVFSYSLSMIPKFERVLHQARNDLRPGGKLIVLDFVESASRIMRAWMRSFGVTLGRARTDAITALFDVTRCDRRRAWSGLWHYQFLVAVRDR